MYQCCICKQKITSEDKRRNEHNPCALTVTTNWDGNVMEQKEQIFFCHFDCFKTFYGDDSAFYSSSKRSKNRIWRVVLIATENYEFPVSLLIGRPNINIGSEGASNEIWETNR